ncbi:MAG TPA: hypothetical protein VHD62_16360 [Opitutaceae bacterium]|nr:hypothetical protein [Opitutaceae bacterium]
MKPLLLAGSLLANLAFALALAFQPALAPPAFRDFFARHFSFFDSAPAPAAAPAHAATVAARPKLWATLHSDDLATLVARMRAAGFPIYAIRATLNVLLDATYGARMRALITPDPNQPFWKSNNLMSPFGGMNSNFAEYERLSRERTKLMKDLLGNFLWHDNGTLSTYDTRRYGGLAPEKIDQIERINADYSEMTSQIRAAMNGVTLPEDREKLALLQREQRADLVAALTPQELEDYDLRNSPTALRLRSQFGFFDATEDEYRTIYRLTAQYADKIYPTDVTTLGNDFMSQRTAAQRELNDQLKAALGDERYAEYARSSDRDYQQLARLAERENIPLANAQQAYEVRNGVARESNRIVADTTLSDDQKRAALQTLAQTTRAQLLNTLGQNAGSSYLKTADNWLTRVERGAAVTFTENGGISYRSVPGGPPPSPIPRGAINTTTIYSGEGGVITIRN